MPDVTKQEQDIIDTFWDKYQEAGIEDAIAYVKEASGGDLSLLELAVPYLVEEARDRNIDMIQFLQELDAHLEKQDDASGTDNGSSELHPDSSDEADQPQIEDESAQARDADGEDRSEDPSV